MGRTFQNEIVRIHRYRDMLQVTDLTNAGKRGKQCVEMTVQPSYSFKGDRDAWLDRISNEFVDRAPRGLKSMKAFIKDLLVDFPGEISLEERTLKGITVEPYGEVFEFEIPQSDGNIVQVRSSPIDFSVVHRGKLTHPTTGKDMGFQDTLYYPDKRKDAAVFYAWMKDNHQKARLHMTMDMFRELWRHLDIGYDYH